MNNSLCELKTKGFITCLGADAASFLQGQLTCDVNKLQPNQGQFAAYCNSKGRVIASFYIAPIEGGFLLALPGSMVPILISKLKRYVLRAKVTLEDASEQYRAFGIEMGRHGGLPLQRCTAFVPHSERAEVYFNQPEGISNKTEDETIWRLLDIQNKIAHIYPETSEQFTPHMLGYQEIEGALCFNKGCYVGQEIVARTHYLGKAKRHLEVVQVEPQQKPIIGGSLNQGTVLDYAASVTLVIK